MNNNNNKGVNQRAFLTFSGLLACSVRFSFEAKYKPLTCLARRLADLQTPHFHGPFFRCLCKFVVVSTVLGDAGLNVLRCRADISGTTKSLKKYSSEDLFLLPLMSTPTPRTCKKINFVALWSVSQIWKSCGASSPFLSSFFFRQKEIVFVHSWRLSPSLSCSSSPSPLFHPVINRTPLESHVYSREFPLHFFFFFLFFFSSSDSEARFYFLSRHGSVCIRW